MGLIVLSWFASQAVTAEWLLRPDRALPNRYLLQFAVDDDPQQLIERRGSSALSLLRQRQADRLDTLKRDMSDTDLVVLRNLWLRGAVAVSLSDRYAHRLEQLDYLTAYRRERFYRAEPQGISQLPSSGDWVQDNLAQVDVDGLWSQGYRGQGVVVAILDSGVDPKHRDLASSYRGGDNSWHDPYGEQPEPIDLSGHGTAVASITLGGDATGAYLGVAPAAEWIAARVFDDSGNSSESAIIDALQWLTDPDGNPQTRDYPDIVQNAWGLAGTEGNCINPFATELAVLSALGVNLVFAVGNSGSAGASSYLTPAFDSHVISVGALQGDGDILYDSSRGPDRCGRSVIPALMAPGEKIKAATLTYDGFDDDNTSIHDGTSFSSPHVSGALALLRSRFRAERADLQAALFETAIDKGAPGPDADFGHGLLQASAAALWLEQRTTPEQGGTLQFSAARHVVTEKEGRVEIHVLRSGSLLSASSVRIAAAGISAVAGEDYLWPRDLLLEFAPGQHMQIVEIAVIDDDVAEDGEELELLLSDPEGGVLGERNRIRLKIADDDVADAEEQIGGASLSLRLLLGLLLLLLMRRRA